VRAFILHLLSFIFRRRAERSDKETQAVNLTLANETVGKPDTAYFSMIVTAAEKKSA